MAEAGDVVLLILAAGKGTRMRSRLSKVLHPVCGRSILLHQIAFGRELGAQRIVVVVAADDDALQSCVREAAQTAIDLGFYISLARPLLRLPHLQQVASKLPLENIVLETDSAPQPFKSKRENWTEPRHLRAIAAKLAEAQNKDIEEVEAVTARNILSLLKPKMNIIEKYVGPLFKCAG